MIKIKKVFLSHSSFNKEFIDSVDEKLPSVVVYDKRSFYTGGEFINIINEFLEESALFVLFASKESLHAPWVQHEIDQAILLKIQGKINQIICIVIDDSDIGDVPLFMRSSKIYKTKNPVDAALSIQSVLNEINDTNSIYFGRNLDADEAVKLLFPLNSEETPYIFSLYGIPGIGRKAFFLKTIMDLERHNFHKSIRIDIEDGETVYSLSVKILIHLKPYSCYEEFRDYTHNLKEMSEEEIINEMDKYIPILLTQQSLICFCDFDNVLDENGYVQENFSILFEALKRPCLFFVTISRRKVRWPLDDKKNYLKLDGVNNEDMQRIVQAYVQTKQFVLSLTQIREIVECASGHPGIAKKIVDMVQEYGFEPIMDDKRMIMTYSNSIFSQHIDAHLKNDSSRLIMSIVNWFSPVPFFVIKQFFKNTNCNLEICSLIDKCIVDVDPETNLITVCPPLTGTISRYVSHPTKEDMRTIANIIIDFNNEKKDSFNIPIALATARIMGLINFFIPDDDRIYNAAVTFDADFVKKVKQFYQDDMFDDAILLAKQIIDTKNKNKSVLNILIKSYIEKNNICEAKRIIEDSENNNWLSPKNICMLKGMLYERESDLDHAIKEYENAQIISPSDVYANMELARCYVVKHEYKKASAIIDNIQNNPLLKSKSKLLDWTIKILTRTGKLSDASSLLKERELLGKDKYYFIRLSDWYHAKGDIVSAIKAAQSAEADRFFSKYMQLASLFFENHDLDSYKQNMDYIEKTFPYIRDFEKQMLKCKLFILQDNYKLAYGLIVNCRTVPPIIKDQIVYLCLTKMTEDVTIPYHQRKEYKTIINALENQYAEKISLLKSLYYDII